MDNNAQINISFPRTGVWTDFTITALYTDADGYDCRREAGPEDVPAEYLGVLQRAVENLVALGEPWSATHVIVKLEEVPPAQEDGAGAEPSALELTAHVRRDSDRACRRFTSAEIPALRIEGAAAVAAFRHFTTPN